MAITIKIIPLLKNKAARDFIQKADEAYQRRGTIDFSEEFRNYKKIIAKSKAK